MALAVFVAFMAGSGDGGTAAPAPTQSVTTPDGARRAPPRSPDTRRVGHRLPSPTPSVTTDLNVLDLGDAKIELLPGWQLYADEVVQDDRRLVRIKQVATDTRIQVVTLTSVTGPLASACEDLIADHRPSTRTWSSRRPWPSPSTRVPRGRPAASRAPGSATTSPPRSTSPCCAARPTASRWCSATSSRRPYLRIHPRGRSWPPSSAAPPCPSG
ncbi:hypothetical protein G7085_00895 [Tessaracoccus sp. HDW20]|uniref:hypothetical protein n=1 Tax=Tessaracoccus coleopterorum TaxID=2714950 RepID=UPI0018D464E1|nr:hypothetical protein [Tessaracoccus coleopterorum]NHB83746.1 hypothetical protein [Tessaracoccus coleopterorum]